MTRTNFRNLALAALAFLLITGCTATRVRQSARDIDPGELEKIEIGETTKAEIISLFGAPVAITANSKGLEVYTFVFGDSRSQVWRVPPILVIYVDSVSSSKTKVLSVTFSGDTVINWSYTVNSAGGGHQAGGVQGGTIGQ